MDKKRKRGNDQKQTGACAGGSLPARRRPQVSKLCGRDGDINGSGPLEAENIRGHGGDFLPGIELQTSWSGKIPLVGLGADREYIEA